MNELSGLSPAAAAAAAATARATATALSDTIQRLTTTTGGLNDWTGTAHDAFTDHAGDVAAHTTLLAERASAGAGIIDDYATELSLLTNRLNAIDTGLAEAEARTRDTTLTLPDFHGAHLAIENWTRQRNTTLNTFDDLSARLAQRLNALIDDIPNRPRTLDENLDDALFTVADTASSALWLGFGWLEDPHAWWADVTAIPGQVWDQTTHPIDTLEDTIALDDWQDGRYGTAAATVGMAIVGRGIGGKVLGKTPSGGRIHGYDEHGRPLGRNGKLLPQSLDEMLAGVDLDRAEAVKGAHTKERHIDVDDQYLKDRITQGTLNPLTGRRSDFKPSAASRWADQGTAEAVITRGMRDLQVELQTLPRGETVDLYVPVPPSAGTIFVKSASGPPVPGTVTQAKITVQRGADGQYSIITAYLEGHP